MLFHLNFIIIIAVLAIIVIVAAFTTIIIIITSLSLFSRKFTMANIIKFFIIKSGLSNKIKLGLSKNIKFSLLKLSSICTTVSTVVNSTVVELADDELYPLLVELVLSQIGDSKEISFALLHSLGLSSASVLQYLVNLGYIIIG